jgi:hypothetical protein
MMLFNFSVFEVNVGDKAVNAEFNLKGLSIHILIFLWTDFTYIENQNFNFIADFEF